MSSNGDYSEKYSIVSQLGAGGYGQVFLGIDKATGRKVAIKKFQSSTHGGLDKSILREISASKACKNNPFVRQIADQGFHQGVPWVAFDCLDYHLLEYTEKLHYNVPFRLIKVILYQILQGLHIMHYDGLIHRDIKPENIFISGLDFPVVKIGDLGHTRGILAMDWPRTSYSDDVGTCIYKAPEQCIPGATYGVSVDLYALGLIACELLLNERIIQAVNELDVVAQQLAISGCDIDAAFEQSLLPKEFEQFRDELLAAQLAYPIANSLMTSVARAINAKALTHWDRELSHLICDLLQFSKEGRPTAREAMEHRAFRDLDTSLIPRKYL